MEENMDKEKLHKLFERQNVKELWRTMSVGDWARKLKVPRNDVARYALELKLNEGVRWSEEELRTLSRLWGTKSVEEISVYLARSESSILIKVKKANLSPKRYWKPEEYAYLRDSWGYKDLEIICRKLNRTPAAVKRKVQQLGLGHATRNDVDYFTVFFVATQLGVKRDTVVNWGKSGLNIEKKELNGSSVLVVTPENLFDWLKNNESRWNTLKLERYAFGLEPQWLKDKRINDRSPDCLKVREAWTCQEDAKLKKMFRDGFSRAQIARHLNRTYGSVDRKLSRISVWE